MIAAGGWGELEGGGVGGNGGREGRGGEEEGEEMGLSGGGGRCSARM